MSRVPLNKKIFDWAIQRRGLSIDDIEAKFPRIGDWIRGEQNPTLKQLESLAKTTSVPVGVYFLADPPSVKLPIPHFRTLKGSDPHTPSPELIDVVYAMQTRQEWLKEFLVEDGTNPKSFIGVLNKDSNRETAAQLIRNELGLTAGWASRVRTWEEALALFREAIEKLGIVVVASGIVGNNTRRKLKVDEFRGFVLVDEHAPLVFVNSSDAKSAQMFTLAHELAHVFLGCSAAFDLRELHGAADPVEKACDEIAAELLVSSKDLKILWPSLRAHDRVRAVAQHFKVSPIVAARRCLDTGLISQKAFFEFYQAYQAELKNKKKGSGGGDFYATQGQRVGRLFGDYVLRAVSSGQLLYSEAYRLTGLYGQTFDKFAASFAPED